MDIGIGVSVGVAVGIGIGVRGGAAAGEGAAQAANSGISNRMPKNVRNVLSPTVDSGDRCPRSSGPRKRDPAGHGRGPSPLSQQSAV